MGETKQNVEFRPHAQPPGGETSQHIYFHYGTGGIDEVHDLTSAQWFALRSDTQALDRLSFEGTLTAAVTPTGGWNDAWKDASWRTASLMWAP